MLLELQFQKNANKHLFLNSILVFKELLNNLYRKHNQVVYHVTMATSLRKVVTIFNMCSKIA